MKSANGAGDTEGKNIMKLITAQEIQNMNKNELAKFFDNLSRAQVQRDRKSTRLNSSHG